MTMQLYDQGGNPIPMLRMLTTAAYVQPAVGSTVAVSVEFGENVQTGEVVLIQNGGWYTVSSRSGNALTLLNIGHQDNVAPGTNVATGRNVAVGGLFPPGVLLKGRATIVAGAGVTVNNTAITATPIIVWGRTPGTGTPGVIRVVVTAGVSFQFLSDEVTDNGVIMWAILQL